MQDERGTTRPGDGDESNALPPIESANSEQNEHPATGSPNAPTAISEAHADSASSKYHLKLYLDIEGALSPLKSFRDILVACEEADTRVPPIAVGVVLDVLLQDFERGFERVRRCDDAAS